MKRKPFLAATSFAFSLLFLSGCQPATVDTNRNANPAETQTVDKAEIEAELLRIENDWPRVIKERDGAAVRRVLADDVIIVYPDGNTANREQDAQSTEAGTMSADSLEMADLKVKILDNDAAIVTGRNILTNGILTTPDGKTIDISGQYRFVDTFARRNGHWKLEAGIATKIVAVTPSASPGAMAPPSARTTPAATVSPAAIASPALPAARIAPAAKPSPVVKAPPARKPSPTNKAEPAVEPTP